MTPHVEELLRYANDVDGVPAEVKTLLRRTARRLDGSERLLDRLQEELDGRVIDGLRDRPWGCDGSGCGEMTLDDGSLQWMCRGTCHRYVTRGSATIDPEQSPGNVTIHFDPPGPGIPPHLLAQAIPPHLLGPLPGHIHRT